MNAICYGAILPEKKTTNCCSVQAQVDSIGARCVYVPVFTTTPWTLPFNRAVCYNPSLQYCLVTVARHGTKHALLWAVDLLHKLDEAGLTWHNCGLVQGEMICGSQFVERDRWKREREGEGKRDIFYEIYIMPPIADYLI